jgi:protein-S-isoprenylcysteine O-methyltransferase Ste14
LREDGSEVVLPIEVVSVLVAIIWGCVAVAWILIHRWETRPVTEARRREIERERAERPRSHIGWLIWIVVARAVTAAIPLLFVIDGFWDRIVILDSPRLSFTAGPDLALQITGIVISAVGLTILIVLGRQLAARVYALAAHERELITTGLHRHVQHPFYVHFALLPVGLFLLTLNYLALLVLVSYTTLWGPKLISSLDPRGGGGAPASLRRGLRGVCRPDRKVLPPFPSFFIAIRSKTPSGN